jgi:ketosteroid isomerase-like protein
MTDTEQILNRLDRLESKDTIRELVTAYALACDQQDMAWLLSLFAQDAEFGSNNGTMVSVGRDAISDMFIETFKIRGPAYHWTHDVTVTVDPNDPNLATGLVYSHAETSPDAIHSISAMRYQDVYRREEDTWRFAKRTISFLYYVPMTEYNGVLARKDRVLMGGKRFAGDYPESLGPWQQFDREHRNG